MNPQSETAPSSNPPAEDPIGRFIELMGKSACGLMKGQATHIEYHLLTDKFKFGLLISLTISSWVTIFLLLWIVFLLEFHSLSISRPSEIESRHNVPVPVERPYEIHHPMEARNVA